MLQTHVPHYDFRKVSLLRILHTGDLRDVFSRRNHRLIRITEVNEMNIPGFNAEQSLGPTSGAFQGRADLGGQRTDAVSMQQFRFRHLGSFGTPLTCCGHGDSFHPPVCKTRIVSPLEQCRCGDDFDGGPAFICRGPVLTRD